MDRTANPCLLRLQAAAEIESQAFRLRHYQRQVVTGEGVIER
jgi:hypothetical protein